MEKKGTSLAMHVRAALELGDLLLDARPPGACRRARELAAKLGFSDEAENLALTFEKFEVEQDLQTNQSSAHRVRIERFKHHLEDVFTFV
jgi:hypothetical protein